MANGVVTTQLSFLPPASSNATEVCGSSERRPATAQPPEPAPTTMKSNVSMTCVFPRFNRRHSGASPPGRANARPTAPRNDGVLRHQPQHLLQPCDLAAVRRIEIGEPVERRTIEHRLELAQFTKTPFSVIGAGARRDALGGCVEVDDRGRFAAEFERDR